MVGSAFMFRIALAVLGASVVVYSASPARAQSVSGSLQGTLREEYSSSVPLSGTLVVGLWLGDLGGLMKPESVYVDLPGGQAESMCFVAQTRDGVYSAEGTLSPTPLQPGRFSLPALAQSKFRRQLALYPALDFAARADIGAACDGAGKSKLVPVITAEGPHSLILALNTRQALSATAWFEQDGKRVDGECSRDTNARSVTFDLVCKFDPYRLSGGEWNLAVRRVPRAGPSRIDDTTVIFPPMNVR